MPKRIRKHLNATTLVAFLALVLATTGGAYAAGIIKITSIRQISKKVVKELEKGKPGPGGPPGAPGATGPQGPQGPQGTAGTNGTNGVSATSEVIKPNETKCEKRGGVLLKSVSGETEVCTGKPGAPGEPWTPNSTLPSGATETGTWALQNTKEGAVSFPVASIPIQLGSALGGANVHLINSKGEELHFEKPSTTPTQCGEAVGGTAAEPKAASGNLCIYVSNMSGIDTGTDAILDPTTGESGASKTGAVLLAVPTSGAEEARGTWAVTG